MKKFFLPLLLHFICTTLLAGTGRLQSMTIITDRNGLSQNSVRCMMQDHNGFIWMGTINGLNRYNGRDFLTIHPRLKTHFADLNDSRIRSITEDANGLMWIRTNSGTVFCYDPRMEQMVDYDPENPWKIFSRLIATTDGSVWLWGSEGCCRVRMHDGQLTTWKPMTGGAVDWIKEDSEGGIWISGQGWVLRAEQAQKINTVAKAECSCMEEVDGKVYLACAQGLMVFDLRSKSLLPQIAKTWNAKSIQMRAQSAGNGLLLLATDRQLYALNTRTGKWIETSALFPGGKDLAKASFVQDNKGGLWIYCMSGSLWHRLDDGRWDCLTLIPEDVMALISQERYSIFHDSRDIIWISTYGAGLYALDARTGDLQHYTTRDGLPTDYLFCVMEDHSGEVWVGTDLNGVVKLTMADTSFQFISPAPSHPTGRANAVRLLYQDVQGQCWVGTRDGMLYAYDAAWHQVWATT